MLSHQSQKSQGRINLGFLQAYEMRENTAAENAPSSTLLQLIIFLSLRWLLILLIFLAVTLSKLPSDRSRSSRLMKVFKCCKDENKHD